VIVSSGQVKLHPCWTVPPEGGARVTLPVTVNADSLAQAPSRLFNSKDARQASWVRRLLPTARWFVAAAREGLLPV
jgi:hypothetical protein